MRFLLQFFPKEVLWKEILKRETFDVSMELESKMVWQSVFHKTPELKQFLKRRESILLKSVTLADKPNDFILGQICENRLWQGFDTPMDIVPKVDTTKEEKRIDKKSFLSQWNAHTTKKNTRKNAKNDEGEDAK